DDLSKNISRMIEDDVENSVHSARVNFVDQRGQFVVSNRRIRACRRRIRGKPRLRVKEVLDSIPMERARLILAVLQDRRKPDCAHAEVAQIPESLPDALEGAALKVTEGASKAIGRCRTV